MASNIWFQLLDLCLCNFPPFLCLLSEVHGPTWWLFLIVLVIWVFPLVYSLFSLRIVPHEPVFFNAWVEQSDLVVLLCHLLSKFLFIHLIFNWIIIDLQCSVAFCHKTWISHNYIYIVVHIYPPSLLSLPLTSPSHPSRSTQSAKFGSLCYRAASQWWLRWLRICLQCRRPGFRSWVKKVPREENGNPVQYSCLENSVERRPWWAMAHGVARSWTWLND